MNRLIKSTFFIFISICLLTQEGTLFGMSGSGNGQDSEYYKKLTAAYAESYRQECNILMLAQELINKFKTRVSEIDDEYEDLMIQLNIFGFPDVSKPDLKTEQSLNARVDELVKEKTAIRNHIEQCLMEKLTGQQQAAVMDYIKKRNNFFELIKRYKQLGGIPFYELDPTVFIPFDQLEDDRSSVCVYFSELTLNGTAPSCIIERAAQAGCGEAMGLLRLGKHFLYGDPMLGREDVTMKDSEASLVEASPTTCKMDICLPEASATAPPCQMIDEDMSVSVAAAEFPVDSDVDSVSSGMANLSLTSRSEDSMQEDVCLAPKKTKKITAANLHYEKNYKAAFELIKKSDNQLFIDWYSGVCILLENARNEASVRKSVKIFESLISLIPEKKCSDVRNFLGFVDVVNVLKDMRDCPYIAAFLVRLGLRFGFKSIGINKDKFIKFFVKNFSESNDSSAVLMLGYLYDNGIVVARDPLQAVHCFVGSLGAALVVPHEFICPCEKEEIVYFLGQKGQVLFDVNFQATPHTHDSFPKDDNQTKSAILACYALVPLLIKSNPCRAASMFIAAENTVAFLCDILPGHEIAYLNEGIIALDTLQEAVHQKNNLDALAAVMFSFARRYMSEICHKGVAGDLAQMSKMFLDQTGQYLNQSKHDNKRRNLLISLACNMYCVMGCKIDLDRGLLIKLMQGVISICPAEYWFFNYNLQSLLAGCQDSSLESLQPFNDLLSQVEDDILITSMIINGLKKNGWGCSIV